MGTMIRRQRRIEYYKVFKGKAKEEHSQIHELAPGDEFQLIDMLGDSFKQSTNRNLLQNARARRTKPGDLQPVNSSFVAIQKNFKELKTANTNKNFIDFENPFSSDYFTYHTTTENYFPLYSVNDSQSVLVEIIDELKLEENPKPKLKYNASTPNTGTASMRAPIRMNSPKYHPAKNPNQLMKPTSNTPSSQRTGFSANNIPEQPASLALANKLFSNPNLSRQNQQEQMQSNGRSRSEKGSSSPSVRLGSKSTCNSSSEKGEPQFFKGRELSQKVGASGAQGLRQNANNEALASNLNTSKRKLMIDMQDININRTNLYKSITDKFKTSKNLIGAEVQLPGKDSTPYTEAGLTITRSNTTKPTMTPLSPGKKYIISKRSESAIKTNYTGERSWAIPSTVNDENLYRLNSGSASKKTLKKSSSQGPTERVLQNYQLNNSGKGSKQFAAEENDTNQVLILKPTISEPIPQVAGSTARKFFQGGFSPGIPKTTPFRRNQLISKGFETPQSDKKNSLFEHLTKLAETPKTTFETAKQNEIAGVGPSFSQAIKMTVDSSRSRSLNPSSSKLKAASPKTRLQSYRDALSNRNRDRSAQNHG